MQLVSAAALTLPFSRGVWGRRHEFILSLLPALCYRTRTTREAAQERSARLAVLGTRCGGLALLCPCRGPAAPPAVPGSRGSVPVPAGALLWNICELQAQRKEGGRRKKTTRTHKNSPTTLENKSSLSARIPLLLFFKAFIRRPAGTEGQLIIKSTMCFW